MSYSQRMQKSNLFSVYMAPRGRVRMISLGSHIAQQYVSPFDHIIGIIGAAGSGKSMLIRGMFPGLDLTNDDEGVNIRPLPLLSVYEKEKYSPGIYHVDICFEAGFTPMHELAQAILETARQEKIVIVEHFERVYPLLGRNADLLIGIGEEVVITRPNMLGPDPANIADLVYKSIQYHLMAHTAEELCVRALGWEDGNDKGIRSDVRRGFVLEFQEKPDINLEKLEADVKEFIAQDMPVYYKDANHVVIGDTSIVCQAPRMHVKSTGEIKDFRLVKKLIHDKKTGRYMLIGRVGEAKLRPRGSMNEISI